VVVTAKAPKASRAGSDAPPRDPLPADASGTDEYLYLTGFPRLKHLLRFVKSHAAAPPTEAALTDLWQASNAVVRRLETEEAGLVENPPKTELGAEYEPLLIEFLKDPLVRNGFNTVPTEVAMVELDRLVVYQKHIDLTFVRQLERKLGPAPRAAEVFRTCLLHDHAPPPVKWARVHQDRFVFMSPSNDLRFLGIQPLEASHLKGRVEHGNLVGIVGIAVGFGSNFLNAVAAENRLILNNGSHRAYALRKLGVTHVPCVIQHVSSREELDIVAASEVRRDPDLYLSTPRPSMLKDYFDPRLHMVLPVYRRLRQITVRFEIEENSLPAL
jgi:hypothetical protein